MALTFGTLLSSQGADAHRRDPFGPFGGNPRYVTRSDALGQTSPAPPASHLVAAHGLPWRVALGGLCPTGPTWSRTGFPAGLGGSVRRTRRRLMTRAVRSQIRAGWRHSPANSGVLRLG